MLAYLRKPHVNLASLFLRLGLAAIFVAQGYILIRQQDPVTEQISRTTQTLVGWTEFVSALALAIGLLSRLAALGLLVVMIGAIALVTKTQGFIPITMTPHGYTFEAGSAYNFLIIIVCLALMVLGSGWVSVDHLIFGRRSARQSAARATGQPHLTPSAVGQPTP
jgi:uncharacterized membrane protein YphA (DoxX/SURF4 family)